MRSDLESLGRMRLQAILLLVVIFAIGGITGAALERTRTTRRPPPLPPAGSHGLPPELRDKLSLTHEQDQRIEAILENNRTRVDAVLDQFLPRLRAVRDSVREEVRAQLTPEQRAVFDASPPGALGPEHLPGPGGPPRDRGPEGDGILPPPESRRGGPRGRR